MKIFLPKDDETTLSIATSVLKHFKVKTAHPACKYLKNINLQKKNLVLIVVDAFGYNLYKKYYEKRFNDNFLGKIYSLYPTATGTSYVSLATGLSVKEHAITGWKVWLKDVGLLVETLPFQNILRDKLDNDNLSQLFNFKSKYNDINIEKYCLDFCKHTGGFSKYNFESYNKYYFSDNNSFFKNLLQITKKPKQKFIFAYYPKIDELSHKFGPFSKDVKKDLDLFFKNLEFLLKMLKNTTIILTADHGQTPVKVITWKPADKIMNYLNVPPAGDSRFIYFYVDTIKRDSFEKFMKRQYPNILLYSKEKLKHLFGKGKEHKKFWERIGDYIGLVKPGYAYSYSTHNKKSDKKGSHSGLTRDELEVPLLIFDK